MLVMLLQFVIFHDCQKNAGRLKIVNDSKIRASKTSTRLKFWLIYEINYFLQLLHARVRLGSESRIPTPNNKPANSLPFWILIGSVLGLGIRSPNFGFLIMVLVRVKVIMIYGVTFSWGSDIATHWKVSVTYVVILAT